VKYSVTADSTFKTNGMGKPFTDPGIMKLQQLLFFSNVNWAPPPPIVAN